MFKLYHTLLLLVIVFFQCVSSHNNEQQPFLSIYTSTESLFTLENFNQFNDCSTNFKTLERALYFMDNNRYALISAFYPARESPTLFLNVRYTILVLPRIIRLNWIFVITGCGLPVPSTWYSLQMFSSSLHFCLCTLKTKYALLNWHYHPNVLI